MSDPTLPVITAGTAEPPKHNYVKWATATFLGLVVIASVALAIVSALSASAARSGEQNAVQQAVHTALVQQANYYGSKLDLMNTKLTQLQAKDNAPRQAQEAAILGGLGVCWNPTYDSTGSYLTGASLTSPVLQNGVRSCPVGTFVPVVAVSTTPGG